MRQKKQEFPYSVRKGNAERLGAGKTGKGMNFAVAVPDEKACSLLLYEKGSQEVLHELPFTPEMRQGQVYAMEVEGLPEASLEYNFKVEDQVILDPYAKMLCGRSKFGEPQEEMVRCGFLEESYDWEGDAPLALSFNDTIAYATHVRGFTKDASSGVRHKGTFLGIKEKLPYLKELGINQLELMPVYEFFEACPEEEKPPVGKHPYDRRWERLNYWGYDKGYYFAPKAAYAASGNAAAEFKDLVKELHKNGIALVLEFYFPRQVNPGLVLECIRYWVSEYHIDGVHFNSGIYSTFLAKDPLLARTKLMCEYFPIADIYEESYYPSFRHLAQYHDGFLIDMRKFLKGDANQLDAFVYRLRSNPGKEGVMNYIACHNGFTLMDLVSYEEKHNQENGEDNQDGVSCNYSWNCGVEGPTKRKKILELRLRQMKNAFLLLLLSQGTPVIYGGDEFGNSQGGNNNVYSLDNPTSWLNWKRGKMQNALLEFVKKSIAFRKAHPIFHQERELKVMDYLSCGYPDVSYHGKRAWYGEFENGNRKLGVMYAGQYANVGQKEEDFFYIAYNMHWEKQGFALPNLPKQKKWRVAIDTQDAEHQGIYDAGDERLLEDQKMLEVPGRTILVLIGK